MDAHLFKVSEVFSNLNQHNSSRMNSTFDDANHVWELLHLDRILLSVIVVAISIKSNVYFKLCRFSFFRKICADYF